MLKKTFVLIISITFILITVGCNNVSDENDETNTKKESTGYDWEQSPLFESGKYTMIGEKGRLGFIYDDDNEVVKFTPNKKQKYMWHFWGEEQEFDGELKVIGTHEIDAEEIYVAGGGLLGPNNGADKHTPSNMSLPKSGMWKLDAYIGENLFGTVYVKVHK